MTPTPAAQRIEWLDAARGLAIVVVVFGHVLRGLEAAGEAVGAAWVGAATSSILTLVLALMVLGYKWSLKMSSQRSDFDTDYEPAPVRTQSYLGTGSATGRGLGTQLTARKRRVSGEGK